YNGTIDSYVANASFQPTQKFHFAVGTNYTDNLEGTLYQATTVSGGLITPPSPNEQSSAFDLQANANYQIVNSLAAGLSADRRQQYYQGKSYSSDAYGEALTYTHGLLGGNINAAGSITENTSSTSSEKTFGFSTTVNYNKRFDGWTAGGFASYSQDVETLLITYMSSLYGYGGNLRRRWGKFGWSGSASVSKTGLTEQAGTTNSSESFSTSVGYGQWVNVNGSYSKSNGTGIESTAGMVATPAPQPV